MNNKIIYIFFFSVIFFLAQNSHSIENKIILKIENRIITTIDIFNEIKILKLLNKNLETLNKDEIREVAKNSLKTEKIKELELEKYFKEVLINDENLNPFLTKYINKLGFQNISDFNQYSKNNNLDINLIKKKISIELLWNQLIYKKFNTNIKIDKEKIQKEILIKKIQNEYLLSEIIFKVESKDDLERKFNLIIKEIETKGFENAAITNSISDTSKDGGKVGWIKETSLSDNMRKILNNVKKEDFTNPIKIPGGYIVLKINDKRKVKNQLNTSDEIDFIIKQQTNKQLSQYSNIFFNKIANNFQINEL